MIGLAIFLIVLLLVVGVLIWAVDTIGRSVPVPAPFLAVAKVLIVLVALLVLLGQFGMFHPAYHW